MLHTLSRTLKADPLTVFTACLNVSSGLERMERLGGKRRLGTVRRLGAAR